MNRRNFIKNSVGASIAGPAVLNNLSGRAGRPFQKTDFPVSGIKSPHDTRLLVKPIMTNMYHTDKWEGPCRFNVVSTEEEKKNAYSYFNSFRDQILKNEAGLQPEITEVIDPSLLLFVEDFKIRDNEFEKIDEDCRNADVLFINPAGSSIATYDIARRYNKPVVIAGVLNCRTVDISAYCRSHGLEVFVPNSNEEIAQIMALLRARKVLSQTRILYPTDWGWPSVASIAVINDPFLLKEKLGVDLKIIPYDEMDQAMSDTLNDKSRLKKADEEAEILYANAEKSFITRNYVAKSMIFRDTIIRLMKKHECNAFTIECFEFCASRLPEKWQITPCMIHTLFKDEGIPSSCEGDLGALLSMQMLMSLSKKSSHLGNMFFRENGVMEINHSAPGIRMNGCDQPPLKYQLGRFVESGWGAKVIVDFMQKPEKEITVARMNPQADGLLVLKGKLTGSHGADEDLLGCSVSAFMVGHNSGTAEEFVRKQTNYGNHLVWVYGDYTRELASLGELLQIKVEVVS